MHDDVLPHGARLLPAPGLRGEDCFRHQHRLLHKFYLAKAMRKREGGAATERWILKQIRHCVKQQLFSHRLHLSTDIFPHFAILRDSPFISHGHWQPGLLAPEMLEQSIISHNGEDVKLVETTS